MKITAPFSIRRQRTAARRSERYPGPDQTTLRRARPTSSRRATRLDWRTSTSGSMGPDESTSDPVFRFYEQAA